MKAKNVLIQITLLLSALAVAQEFTKTKKCSQKFNVTKQDIQDFKIGKVSAVDLPESVQCAIECVLKEEELIDIATNTFNPEKLKALLPDIFAPESIDAALEICKVYKKINSCEDAAVLLKCLWTLK